MGGEDDTFTLPCGHKAVYLRETPSTNACAMELAQGGATPPLWIWAGRQTKGRGRLGRGWDSPEGNLYASLLLRPGCAPEAIGGLPLLAGLAARDAIAEVAGDAPFKDRLRLKWPNDIMLDGAKLGGVLIESAVFGHGPRAVVIGSGLNIAAAPAGTGRPVTCLRDQGCDVAPTDLLGALADATSRWLDVWAGGTGFAHIRRAWLRHADPLGAPISVRLGGDRIEGRFGGLDDTGALRLRLAGGERRITAGDVHLGWDGPGGRSATAHHE